MTERDRSRGQRSSVTRSDVARYAGVSTAVVSYVINGGPKGVAPATAARVREAIEVLRYQPNASARALRLGSSRLLGVVAPSTINPFFAELIAAIGQAAANHGHDLLLANSGRDLDVERSNTQQLVSRQVDGLLIASMLSDSEVAATSTRGIPTVILDRAAAVHGLLCITSDFEQGAADGVRHLIEHGHRDITLLIGRAPPGQVDAREIGWMRALGEADLPLGDIVRTDFSREDAYQAIRGRLASPKPPTAIFASSDLEAIGALRAIHEAGLSIPGQVAVVSFDGTAESEFSWPQLTTVRQPVQEMAEAAVTAILNGRAATGGLQTYPTQLVVRRSCGC
jgi:LacI family transcriptional regulator